MRKRVLPARSTYLQVLRPEATTCRLWEASTGTWEHVVGGFKGSACAWCVEICTRRSDVKGRRSAVATLSWVAAAVPRGLAHSSYYQNTDSSATRSLAHRVIWVT